MARALKWEQTEKGSDAVQAVQKLLRRQPQANNCNSRLHVAHIAFRRMAAASVGPEGERSISIDLYFEALVLGFRRAFL